MTPFYERAGIQLFLGDCREILPSLALQSDCIIADVPYNQTSLAWDKWPDGWIDVAADSLKLSGSMWCFGSLKMFMAHASEFSRFTFAQGLRMAQA